MKPDPIGYWIEDDRALPVYDMADQGAGLRCDDLVAAADDIRTLGEWCDGLGVARQAARYRLRRGWRIVDALSIAGAERMPHDVTPYEEDRDARAFVAQHSPATLEHVGLYFGVTRERIRQIETAAIRKLRKVASRELWEAIEDIIAERQGAL